MGEMLETVLMLATIILHLGVGIAIALRGRLLLAAIISALIVTVPLIGVRLFGSPHQFDGFVALVATPLGAITLFVGIAGVIMALVRWMRLIRQGT